MDLAGLRTLAHRLTMKQHATAIAFALLFAASAAVNIFLWQELRLAQQERADMQLALEKTNRVAAERSAVFTMILNEGVEAKRLDLEHKRTMFEHTKEAVSNMEKAMARLAEIEAERDALLAENAELKKPRVTVTRPRP